MLHYFENNLLQEKKYSTTAGASSTEAGASSSEKGASLSPEIRESSSRAGAPPQEVGVSLAEATPATSLGDVHFITAGASPDVPHHETASTRYNPTAKDTSTTHTRQEHRGRRHRLRVWRSPTPIEARYGSRRWKIG